MKSRFKKTYPSNRTRLDSSAWIAIKGLLLVFCFSIAGCDKSIADTSYQVIDTGFWINAHSEPAWLDNERVIFPSSESLAPDKPPYHVKVLNTVTGKLFSTSLSSFICVRNGQVFYGVRDEATDKITYYRGALENANERPAPGPDMKIDSNFDCDWVPQKSAARIGFDSYPANSKLRGENYLEIIEPRTHLTEHQKGKREREYEQRTGDTGSKGKTIYHAKQSDPGTEVPPYGFTYSEFLDAYVVSMNFYDPKEPETRSFWILERNGDLKEVPYPKKMLEGRVDVFPLKQGYLAYYSSGKFTMTDSGDHGLYFIQGETVQSLIVGLVGGVRISPDGCSAAFIHARTVTEDISINKPYRTVKIINFCQGDSKP